MKPTAVEKTPAAKYQLETAALVYSNKQDTYITLHPVAHKDGRAIIGAGAPATKARLAGVVAAISGQIGMRGWVDPRILYLASQTLVWWRPAAMATMHFTKHQKHPARSGVCTQPPLVFAVTAGEWFVWALDTLDRPTPNTPLAHAPYFNVWSDGGICTGNVKMPREIGPETIAHFEDAFFGSRFTHPNHEPITRSDPFAVWAKQLDQRTMPFPWAELIPTSDTLGETVERVAKG